MRITVNSTTKMVELNGVPARIWEGRTEDGVPIHCFITRIAVDEDEDRARFEAELQSHRVPRNPDIEAIPNRLVL